VDLSWAQLKKARLMSEVAGLSLPALGADLEHLPFGDGTFNTVVAFDALEHLSRLPEAVAEVFRVLLPGGVFIASMPNRYGLYALVNDYPWSAAIFEALIHPLSGSKQLFKELLYTLRCKARPVPSHFANVPHLHLWSWRKWKAFFEQAGFREIEVHSLEFLCPVLAKLAGHRRMSRASAWDVHLARHLPVQIAAEILFRMEKEQDDVSPH